MNKDTISDTEPTNHKLLFDPVPFSGGSKIAVNDMLALCKESGVHFTVLTSDPNGWKNSAVDANLSIIHYAIPHIVQAKTQGLGYWFKQLMLFLIIRFTLIKLRLNGQKVSTLIGISGPGVDMALYLCKRLTGCKVIQLIQGPVAASRSVGYCLTKADKVFYLRSAKFSLVDALRRYFCSNLSASSANDLATFHANGPSFLPFDNGLNLQRWPTPCEYLDTEVFWAASLLEWKGLDTLVAANQLINRALNIQYRICYIQPENTDAKITRLPQNEKGMHCYEKPTNLDEIRSRCSIFVSTSRNEPFGLSILESLAAGLCVIIPADNAYWDQQLEDGHQCLKYQPDNPRSLANTLSQLAYNPTTIQKIGRAGQKVAQEYRASVCYRQIVDVFTDFVDKPTLAAVGRGTV